ncbi:molybdate ABC transporter substrate-binding protein [Aliiglaciecola lipolytica]|uniref:Molybdate transport system substrate-binding protein n=1 Tax=Aliiglaciecola lipolytica E3 TaxID=1127673 RepID=K6YTL8_9ALTE|nr:molybdate ABC transporter substrate-binding protein [Aliiglaciecola lipolytica]GAC14635.1 molybdate transport system substrate-binding protein [Aliiglaciecola lipolytica E3]
MLILLFGVSLSIGQFAQAKETVYVAVASNFLTTFKQLQIAFEQTHQSQLIVSAGSTGKLYAQITHGAPYDLFFSADDVRPQQLQKQGFTHKNKAFTYAFGRLAVYHPAVDSSQFCVKLLSNNDVKYIAIANPKIAPYGEAAKDWMTSKQIWQSLKNKIVMGENVNQALQFVETGNAQMGFIAMSMTGNLPTHSFTELDDNNYQAIRQQAVLITNKPEAAKFVAFLSTQSARDIILKSGYILP